MAAYASLLSLMHTIEQIKNHPHPPIRLDNKQVQSLTINLTFLQTFLEGYSNKEEDELERRIAGAAYAAEDVIESHIVDQIEDGTRPLKRRASNAIRYSRCQSITSADLFEGLQRVIQDMDLIKKEVMLMGSQDQVHRRSSPRLVSTWQNRTTMVGFDDALMEVMDKLIGQQDNLQVIAIVGMGGIGKTKFATNIYTDSLIVQHFDILAWVTISQDYNRREFLHVLCQETKGSKNDWSLMSEDDLGERVYKELWGRRYLIVMDDIWSIKAWESIKSFFPDNNNASKIMITTRLSNLALQLSGSQVFQMKFLDEDKSWDLLCEIVFAKESCPIELEDIGKKIVKNCRGLPLSIVVIGGLLAKSDTTREYWEYTLENLNSCINLEDEEYCLQVLQMSYEELPVHLKPCFLYMGVFCEDGEIHVSDLVRLLVAEGFMKPIVGKCLEKVAKEYINELIDRNLILVRKLSWRGKTKTCKIHDLLRDLCIREAQKQKFLCITSRQDLNIQPCTNMERRICILENMVKEYSSQLTHAFDSARSLLFTRDSNEPLPSLSFRFLRVYSVFDEYKDSTSGSESLEVIFQRANLRYLSIVLSYSQISGFPSSWSLLWNLHTLKILTYSFFDFIIAPPEFWEMRQLRHVMVEGLVLPDPPIRDNTFVLENLRTLSTVSDFKCSQDVVKRIPNIKTLKLDYDSKRSEKKGSPDFYFNNLGHLQKLLESLELFYSNYEISNPEIFRYATFPHSLKKLILRGTMLYWDDFTTKVGSLPLLEFLFLYSYSCIGPKWETVEGQFPSLQFLRILGKFDLKYWETDSTHFPRLKHLVLQHLLCLEEIPSSIGGIFTLESIEVANCSKTVEASARRIKDEQEDYGNADLQVLIGSETRRGPSNLNL